MSNTTIMIPPFPAQDLAKLVLGYLAEEQLMTAYDEFLQASPYLDALRNEYDRIFMTSLKNILAEYRAVKIYVETCKPFILRRKLFQCTNLLEIVKFLVNNVDVNKLHLQEGSVDKTGCNRHSFSKSINTCDVCISLKLSDCTCRTTQSTSQIEASSLEESVETTSLADLPGTTSYKKKITKEAEPKSNNSHSITSSDQVVDGKFDQIKDGTSTKLSNNLSSTSFKSDVTENVISSVTENKCPVNTSLMIKDKEHQPESRQELQDLNKNNVELVSVTRNDSVCKQKDCSDTATRSKIGSTDKLQIVGAGDSSRSNKVIVPDSSTSENIVLQTPTTETDNVGVTLCTNVSKGVIRPPPLLIKIGNEHKHVSLLPNTALNNLPRLASKETLVVPTNKKTEDRISPKITIISDVKLDNNPIMPPILKGANSTPLVPMQTLFINGTQAYKNTQQVGQTFTKDEIMAMPTIILVPALDKTKKVVPTVTQDNMMNNSSTTVSLKNQSLEPLVIDVSSNDDTSTQDNNTVINDSVKNPEKQTNDMLIKTVDVTSASHASLPKDNTLAGLKTSTPHVLPPTRKSSSTPRRTSHVRVLDFATPRRILHETLNKQEVKQCSNDAALIQESSLPAVNDITEDTVNKVNNTGNADTTGDSNFGATKENKTTIKLYNWDSELRALAYVGNGNVEKSEPTRKPKSKKSKKKLSPTKKNKNNKCVKSEDVKANSSNDKMKLTPKIKNTKIIKKSLEVNKVVDETHQSKVSVVPTIHIVSRKKPVEPTEAETSQNKSSSMDGNTDTPDLEKISLHNEIGVKLNISDLLETPYKQALYDIQMETPKFLGPDIIGDPLSDIKIMNIPTPRFLNTPKLAQNTPSSYSSRPTDYSSGGSYYKPDDQDYVLGNDVIDDIPVSSITSNSNKDSKVIETQNNVEKVCEGKSRPVRKCTKNVSYNYGTPSTSRVKDTDEKMEKSSTCSESSVNKPDKKIEKIKISKSDKDNVGEKQKGSKKKSKKYKSPIKKEAPKTFMKIKPRRTTPVKEVLGKSRKKGNDLNQIVYIKSQPKKMIAGKERNVCFSPIAVAPVLTKSRRKSSTPRKLHYTKRFNSESSSINSPDRKKQTSQSSQNTNVNACSAQDSDSEQQPLRWSDDGSQESKIKTTEEKGHSANESDDITKIKEYIKTTENEVVGTNDGEGTLQVDLIKRGFDVETARMIERDLLETPAHNLTEQKITVGNISESTPSPISCDKKNESKSKKSDKSIESDCSTSNILQIVQDENDYDEFDFSVQECNESTKNYFAYNYDESMFIPSNQVKLKDTFSMEICIENDLTIRLRAMPFNTVFEHDAKHEVVDNSNIRTVEKPTSPLRHDTLYTPRKAQCYEIFDSTLTSLDTPLKTNSPKVQKFETITEIVLEVEKLETDIKVKPESKKRKRIQSGTSDESTNGSKKVKPDTYLLNSAGIQNIDIESVLSKLHGP